MPTGKQPAASRRRPCHWVVLFGREWRVPRRVQRWWGRYGVYIAGSTNTISDYEDDRG